MPQLYNDDIYVGDFAIETPQGKLNISESGVSVVNRPVKPVAQGVTIPKNMMIVGGIALAAVIIYLATKKQSRRRRRR